MGSIPAWSRTYNVDIFARGIVPNCMVYIGIYVRVSAGVCMRRGLTFKPRVFVMQGFFVLVDTKIRQVHRGNSKSRIEPNACHLVTHSL